MKRLMILCIGLLFFIPIQLNARKYFCEIKFIGRSEDCF